MYPYFLNKDELDIKMCNDNSEFNMDDGSNMKNQADYRMYILQMIEDSILDGNKDMNYYERLSQRIQDEDDKNTLRRIHLNKMKHKKMLMEIYNMLTSEEPNLEGKYEEREIGDNLLQEFENSIERELEGSESYRVLLSSFEDLPVRDMVHEMLIDEQNNAQRMNHLYSKYR